jgi:hypothetical protein
MRVRVKSVTLVASVVISLLVGCAVSVAGVAQMRSGPSSRGPFRSVPADPPSLSREFPGMYRFDQQSLDILARVPSLRTLIVREGKLTGIYSNSRSWDLDQSRYVVRLNSIDGPIDPMTPEIWAQARAALARAREPYGYVLE